MNKFLIFLFVSFSFLFARGTELPAKGFSDSEVFLFLLGQWQLGDAACLSGKPVYWGGGDPKDFVYSLEFKSNATFEQKLSQSGQARTSLSGSFGISSALLLMSSLTVCQFGETSSTCYSQAGEQKQMVSIQNDQLWLLSSQGRSIPGRYFTLYTGDILYTF